MTMKKNEITHTGKIVEITPDFTTVQIVVSSACASCHAKSLCGMSEDEEKVIMLPTDPYATYNVGDEVQVYTKMSMGLKDILCDSIGDFNDFNIIFVSCYRK